MAMRERPRPAEFFQGLTDLELNEIAAALGRPARRRRGGRGFGARGVLDAVPSAEDGQQVL